jgi:hypothetical protein
MDSDNIDTVNIKDMVRPSSELASVKQVRVDGCQFQLSETQIRLCLGNYGVIQGDIIKEAVTDVVDNLIKGTRSYLVTFKLFRRLPNWIPMFGMKVKLSYKGGKMACKSCFCHHKTEVGCIKRKWLDYIIQFKADNKDINKNMINPREEPKQKDGRLEEVPESISNEQKISTRGNAKLLGTHAKIWNIYSTEVRHLI